MSAISEFSDRVSAHLDRLDQAHEGLSSDLADLKATIEKLQGTAGQVTPEDQALLNQLEAKIQAASDKLAAMDDLHPPTPPVEPAPTEPPA